MNIFIMFLVFIFMAGFYLMDSPNQKVQNQNIDEYISKSELRKQTECVKNAHIFNLKDLDFKDLCKDKYNIKNLNFCVNQNNIKVSCNGKQAYKFFITYSEFVDEKNYNLTAEVFEKYYKDITDFGILINNNLITGLRTYKLDKIITQYIKNGSLIYFTKYKNQSQIKYLKPINIDTPGNCPKGTIMTYKFGRYVCLEKNKQFACIGDTIWDKKKEKCVPNYFNRPICGENMVAILKNNVWECLDSIEQNTEIQCAENQIKTYNKYSQKYICTEDPNKPIDIKKCTFEKTNLVYGKLGSTLKIQKISTKCNECEKQIINEDTCESFCIPDKTKLKNQNCYKNAQECAGNNKSFYFGFPNQEYVKNVKEVYNYKTPINSEYSKNRKFNCKKCEKGINEEKSIYPLILICN